VISAGVLVTVLLSGAMGLSMICFEVFEVDFTVCVSRRWWI
jgi:hypothetical protein